MLNPSFSVSVFLSTLILSAVTLPHSQPRDGVSLELSLEVPSSVDGVDQFTITGALKSDSTKDIKVVADPSSILFDYFSANALDFTKESDEKTKPDFVGGIAKWSIETYLFGYKQKGASDSEEEENDSKSGYQGGSNSGSSDYTSDDDTTNSQNSGTESSNTSGGSSQGEEKTYPPHTTQNLPAGKSMPFKYNVGKGYDFTKSGAGVYNVKLSRDFFWVLVDDVLTKVKVDVTSSSTVTIKGPTLVGKFPHPTKVESHEGDTNKRQLSLRTIACAAQEITTIDKAATISNQLKASSLEGLVAMAAEGSDRGPYEHWFGDWETKGTIYQPYRPRDQVKKMYGGLRPFNLPGNLGGYTYDCSCKRTVMSHVVLGEFNETPKHPVIHLCEGFRSEHAPISGGTDTKAGALLHEATHFPFVRPPTEDLSYGMMDTHALNLGTIQGNKKCGFLSVLR